MLTITGPVDVDDGLYFQAADIAQKLAKENLQAHTPLPSSMGASLDSGRVVKSPGATRR